MSLSVAVLKETRAGERRVAMVPAVVDKLVKLGAHVPPTAGGPRPSRPAHRHAPGEPAQRMHSCPRGQHARRARRRGGFSLLEVILALAILVAALAVLGELVRSGVRNAQMARDLSRAQVLCESKLGEVFAGAIPAEKTSKTVKATQIQGRAKPSMPESPSTRASAKLQTAYIPSGKTVDQRRTS